MISRLSRSLVVVADCHRRRWRLPVFTRQRRRCRCARRATRSPTPGSSPRPVPAIEKGTVVMRDGVIEDVGAAVQPRRPMRWSSTAPGSSSIRASSTCRTASIVEGGAPRPPLAPPPRRLQAGRGRGGAAVATPDNITWADQEREARTRYLHPDVDAAKIVEIEGRRCAAARGGRHHLGARGPAAGHHPRTERARQRHGAARSERDQRAGDLSSRRRRRASPVSRSTSCSRLAEAAAAVAGAAADIPARCSA